MTSTVKFNFISGYALKSKDLESMQDILRTQIVKSFKNILGNVYILNYNEFESEVYFEKSIIKYKDYIFEVKEQRATFSNTLFINNVLFLKITEALNTESEPFHITIHGEIVLEGEEKANYDNYIPLKNVTNTSYAVAYDASKSSSIEIIKPFKINAFSYTEGVTDCDKVVFRDGIVFYNNKNYVLNFEYLDYDFILGTTNHADYIYNSDGSVCNSFYIVYSDIQDSFSIKAIKKGEYVDTSTSYLIDVPTSQNEVISKLKALYFNKNYNATNINDVPTDYNYLDSFYYYEEGSPNLFVEKSSDYNIVIIEGLPFVCVDLTYSRYLTTDVKIVEDEVNLIVSEDGEVNFLHTKPYNYIDSTLIFHNDKEDIKIYEHDKNCAHLEMATPIQIDTNTNITYFSEGDTAIFIGYNLNKPVKYNIIQTPNMDLNVSYGLVKNVVGNTKLNCWVKSCDRKQLDYINGLIVGKLIDISNSSYTLQTSTTPLSIETLNTELNINEYQYYTLYPDFNLIIDKNVENVSNTGFDRVYNLYLKLSNGFNVIHYWQNALNVTSPTTGQFVTNNPPSEVSNYYQALAINHFNDTSQFCNKLIDFKDDLSYHFLINFDTTLLNGDTGFFYPTDQNAYAIRNFNSFNPEDSILNVEDLSFTSYSKFSDEYYVQPEMHRIGNVYVNNEQIYENFITNNPYSKSYLNYSEKAVSLWLFGEGDILDINDNPIGKLYGRFKVNKGSFLNLNYLKTKPANINTAINSDIPAQFFDQVLLYEQTNTGDLTPSLARSILNGEIISGSLSSSFFCYVYKKTGDDTYLYITIKSDNADLIGTPLYSVEFKLKISDIFANYAHLLNFSVEKTKAYDKKIYSIQTSSNATQSITFDTRINKSHSITSVFETFNTLDTSVNNTYYNFETYDKMVIGKNKTLPTADSDSIKGYPFHEFLREEIRSDTSLFNFKGVDPTYKNSIDVETLIYQGNTDITISTGDSLEGISPNYFIKQQAKQKPIGLSSISIHNSSGNLITKKVYDAGTYTKEYYDTMEGKYDEFSFQLDQNCTIKKFYIKVNNSSFNEIQVDSLLFYSITDAKGNCLFNGSTNLDTLDNGFIELYILDHIDFLKDLKYIFKIKTYNCRLSINLKESYISYIEYIEPTYNYRIDATNSQNASYIENLPASGSYQYQTSLLKGSKDVYYLNDTDKQLYLDYSGYGKYKSPVLNAFYSQSIISYNQENTLGIIKYFDVDFTGGVPTNIYPKIHYTWHNPPYVVSSQEDHYVYLNYEIIYYNSTTTLDESGKTYYKSLGSNKSFGNIYASRDYYNDGADVEGVYEYTNTSVVPGTVTTSCNKIAFIMQFAMVSNTSTGSIFINNIDITT